MVFADALCRPGDLYPYLVGYALGYALKICVFISLNLILMDNKKSVLGLKLLVF
jgi:hypothetical protein